MYQDLAAANSDAYWDAKIEEAEAQYTADMAAAMTEEEKKKIERRYKNNLAIYKSEKLINHKWNSEWHAADTFNVAIGQGR